MRIAVGKSTSAYLWLFVFFRLGCGQDIFKNDQPFGFHKLMPGYSPYDGPPQATPRLMKESCSAPPQPENGQWRIHPYFCKKRSAGCNVLEGSELALDYELIYNCTIGYSIEGDDKVYCDPPGKWSTIPTCRDTRCATDMGPGIRISNCVRYGESVTCEGPVLPDTSVELSCQDGWAAVPRSVPKKPIRTCNTDGGWLPIPVECVLQCEPIERITTKLNTWHGDVGCYADTGLSTGSWEAAFSDFPWQATLYKEKRSPDGEVKTFLCGATIIQNNFVITAAHCIYDETTRTTEDAGKLYIMAGNQYRDYDHPQGRLGSFVQRTAVKKVNLPFHYYGLRGNYGSDIALLELQNAFQSTGVVSPAFWDSFSPDAPILQNGAIGKVAGFGRTETLDSSPTLRFVTAPYVPNDECQVPADTSDNYVLINKDKFCAGYTNGTAVCDGDSGGGLMFENNKKWYVMGIVSVSLGVDLSNGERTCSKHALTVYTKVSEYNNWIREVISDPERSRQSPSSSGNWKSFSTISAAPMSPVISSSLVAHSPTTRSSFCVSPQQPTNGHWKLHPTECTVLDGSTDCSVAAGVELEAGTALVYSCNAGYKATGHPEVYCGRFGRWSNIPHCVTSNPPINHRTPVMPHGGHEIVGELPWQASFYEERDTPEGTKKEFQCEATIIKANLLLTAKHCVYDERTNTSLDPKKLFVMAGNIYPDYDSPLHDRNIVKKSAVLKLYVNCCYTGLVGNFHASETALLQLKEPLRIPDTHAPRSSVFEDYSEALRDFDLRKNIFIFRTARGSVVCNNHAGGGLVIDGNTVWHVLKIASGSDYST